MVKTAFGLVADAGSRIEMVTPEQLAAELASGDVLVVDVRDSEERQAGYIPGSIHVPRVSLEFAADPTSPAADGRLRPDRRVVVHCGLGFGSALATDRLREMGYEAVANLQGGYKAWVNAGLPVDSPDKVRDALLG